MLIFFKSNSVFNYHSVVLTDWKLLTDNDFFIAILFILKILFFKLKIANVIWNFRIDEKNITCLGNSDNNFEQSYYPKLYLPKDRVTIVILVQQGIWRS